MTVSAPDTPDHAAPAPTGGTDDGAADRIPAQADGAQRRHTERSGTPSAGRNGGRRPQRTPQAERPAGPAPVSHHPVLDQLATLYPMLFGARFVPLKRGIFEELLAAHPDALDKDSLKAALAQHARSSRYLTAVAAGLQRHDLNGQPVEALTPEQVHHALLEVFRRRGARSPEDLRPKLRQRILKAYEASGLSPDAYIQRMLGRDEEVNQITREALADASDRAAREDALLRTFEASGKPIAEFADMYGLHLLDANRSLERARARRAAAA